MKIVHLGEMRNNIEYIFLNYLVNSIPSWLIRKCIYKLFGMKIGKGSRIMMKCIVLSPENISIGERTIINEFCFIDGRGILTIGNDCAISVYCKLITGSHDYKSDDFKYVTDRVDIGDNVWICSSAIITSSANIKDKCVISAGSVFRGTTIENGIYVGNPARLMKHRLLEKKYEQAWMPYFR